MNIVKRNLSRSFNDFFQSEKASGILLILCTLISLTHQHNCGRELLTPLANQCRRFERRTLDKRWADGNILFAHRLDLERELYVGELSDFKNALLPIFAAVGGICLPALIHFTLNSGTPAQAGIGIPMATDIAFALGVLALLGDRVPASLKVYLTALAVIDDLGAIIVIAIFYTAKLQLAYLLGALAVFGLLVTLNRFRVMSMIPYVLGGIAMWFLMLKSGVHATISGVLLAFAIPFTGKEDDEASPSHKLEHILHKPVAFSFCRSSRLPIPELLWRVIGIRICPSQTV